MLDEIWAWLVKPRDITFEHKTELDSEQKCVAINLAMDLELSDYNHHTMNELLSELNTCPTSMVHALMKFYKQTPSSLTQAAYLALKFHQVKS